MALEGMMPNIGNSIMQGVQLGMLPDQIMAQRQQLQAQQNEMLAKQQAQAQMLERQRQLQQGMASLARNPNPTMADYQTIIPLMPKEQGEMMLKTWEAKTKDQQQGMLSMAGQVMSALRAKPELGIQIMQEQEDAAKAKGDAQTAQALSWWRRTAEADPGQAAAHVGVIVSQLPGGKELIEAMTKANADRRAEEMQPATVVEAQAKARKAVVDADFAVPMAQAGLTEKQWGIKNLQNQINVRGAQLGLDRQRLAIDVQEKLVNMQQKLSEIPAGSQKLVNDAAVTAGAAKQQAATLNDLSGRIMQIGTSWGALGSAGEWLKKAGGMQGGVTELRQEYTRLRNSAAVSSLPPGPATDKDIAMVLEGFPPSTASPQVLSSFLRGMAKIKDIEAASEGAKVDWLAGNRGSLTRANSAFMAGDYAVKAGETWPEFQARISKDVAQKYTAPKPSMVDQIPTPRNPNPMGNRAAIMDQADAIIRGGR